VFPVAAPRGLPHRPPRRLGLHRTHSFTDEMAELCVGCRLGRDRPWPMGSGYVPGGRRRSEMVQANGPATTERLGDLVRWHHRERGLTQEKLA
jgi:hypothetical protein